MASCPANATALVPTDSCSATGSSPVCFSISNFTSEAVTAVGLIGTVTYCFTAPPGATPTALTTVIVGVPSQWTVTGATSGRVYFSELTIEGPTTLHTTDTPVYTFYTRHAPIPWALLTIIASLATLLVIAYGLLINRRARADVCSRYPGLCTTLEQRDPKTGRLSLHGYPSGFRKNGWAFPAGVLALVAVAVGAGWYASTGGFGFSTLTWDQCAARPTGWGWTALDESTAMRAAVQWLGLGKCANSLDESNCYVFSKTTNSAYAYDEVKAQSPGDAYQCACVNTTTPTQSVDCLSSNAPGVLCAQCPN